MPQFKQHRIIESQQVGWDRSPYCSKHHALSWVRKLFVSLSHEPEAEAG